MNNKEEIIILAEMQNKSLGFVDINDISNSLHIDKEYVIEVVKDKYIFVDGSLL